MRVSDNDVAWGREGKLYQCWLRLHWRRAELTCARAVRALRLAFQRVSLGAMKSLKITSNASTATLLDQRNELDQHPWYLYIEAYTQ